MLGQHDAGLAMASVGAKTSIYNSSKEIRVLGDGLVSKGPEFRSPEPVQKAGCGGAMEWQRQKVLCNSTNELGLGPGSKLMWRTIEKGIQS